jgi:hypothetical protein
MINHGRRWNSAVLALLTVSLSLTFVLVVTEIVLRFLPVTTSMERMPVDENHPILRFPSNKDFVFSTGWNFQFVNYGRFNNYGFVNNQDYTRLDGAKAFAIIGDSYVEALQVPYDQTVQGRLAQYYEGTGKVYSFGMSGAQLAQYMAMSEYVRNEFQPQGMVIVIVGNDFDESLIKVRPGLHLFEKNQDGQSLRLVRWDYHPGAVEKTLRHSATARYLWNTVGIREFSRLPQRLARGEGVFVGNTLREAPEGRLRDSRLAVEAFFSELPHRAGLDTSQILFVVDGMRPDLYSEPDLERAKGSYFDLMRQYFMSAAVQRGYEVIDTQPLFLARHRQDGSRFERPTDGHWTGLGHQVVAEAIASSSLFQRLCRCAQ